MIAKRSWCGGSYAMPDYASAGSSATEVDAAGLSFKNFEQRTDTARSLLGRKVLLAELLPKIRDR